MDGEVKARADVSSVIIVVWMIVGRCVAIERDSRPPPPAPTRAATMAAQHNNYSLANCSTAAQWPCHHFLPPPVYDAPEFRRLSSTRHWSASSTRGLTRETKEMLPAAMALEPWANPVDAEWCAPPARPRIFVIMTAAVQAFVNLARRGLKNQQRNTTERREMYEQTVRRWATASNVGVVFAENSGADLGSIEAQVPPWRRERFEFLSVPRMNEKLPPRARPDVGRLEAQAIVYALNNSQLLATRCPHDLVFGCTGRYFIHDFEHLVHRQCLKGKSGDELPLVTPQKPEWVMRNTARERETSVLGFAAGFALEIFGWSVMPVGHLTFQQYAGAGIGSEVHLGKLVKHMDASPALKKRVCDLPPLPIMPVREGSSGIYRESV